MRAKYWSCTKFADWIRGENKPSALPWDEWDTWRDNAKQKHPVRTWIAEEVLDKIQDFLCFPGDKIHSLVYWINRRFIDKSHIIQTGLKKGAWHEVEEKLLHGMFEELVTFVETQKASMSWHEENTRFARVKNDHFVPWTEKNWFTRNLTDWRSEHYGVQHLLWEITLVVNKDWTGDESEWGKPTRQAIDALEILELYVWWKYIRPMRKDPYDESGWTAVCAERRNSKSLFDMRDEDEDHKALTNKALDRLQELEQQYDNEDTDMMVRLVKVRKSLWT